MCNVFKKKKIKKKNKRKSKSAMPCWTSFFESKHRKEKAIDKKTGTKRTPIEELDASIKTASLIADLPSTDVKSIGVGQETTLSQPMSSAAFEWNTPTTPTTTSSRMTSPCKDRKKENANNIGNKKGNQEKKTPKTPKIVSPLMK